jgi:hypothetical protein
MSIREVRLKAEYSAEYPGIPADVWLPAKETAKSLVERGRARGKLGRFTRTFDPAHFEFRGGTGPRPPGPRTRITDRSQRGSHKTEKSPQDPKQQGA